MAIIVSITISDDEIMAIVYHIGVGRCIAATRDNNESQGDKMDVDTSVYPMPPRLDPIGPYMISEGRAYPTMATS